MPTIMPPNMRFMENAKRSEFNAKISVPMDKNPWYLTATSKELNRSGSSTFFKACAPIAPNTMDIMMNSPERITYCFCMSRRSEKFYSYQICIFVK